MNIQTAQLQFIEEYVKLKNMTIIEKLSAVLKKEKTKQKNISSVLNFVGIIDKDEAIEIKKVIEEGCEKIDKNEW